MHVSLTPELEHFTRTLVKTGDFNSASEVMREALRLLKKSRSDDRKRDELRSLIQEGMEGGPAVTMTSDQLRETIHQHASQLRTNRTAG